MKNDFKAMDSDMHVMEPPDLWERYMDPAYRDRAPKGSYEFLGDMRIKVEGHQLPYQLPSGVYFPDPGYVSEKGLDKTYRVHEDADWDASSQVLAMDQEGLDIAVLYPSRGLFALAVDGMDPQLAVAIARAYNNWMYDFCSYAPDRIFGAVMVSPFDVESAVEETRRGVKDLGFKGVFLRPNFVNGRNWHDPYYDPLWAEIQDLGVPLGFHEGSNAAVPQVGARFQTYMMHHTCCHSMELMLAVVSMIGGGVLERFPGLKVGFLEGNCSWAPWLLWRLNEHYELSGRFESPELKLEPKEYFQRQCYVSVEPDEDPAACIEGSGLEDTIVFSTDYPHTDSKFPYAIDALLELPISEENKAKFLWSNCAMMYGFS